MTREQAKELLPILQAFAEGKEVEIKTKEGSEWSILKEDDMQYIDFKKCDLRIKLKYRPFASKEECWQEMLKHQPFGWVKAKNVENAYYIIDGVYYSENFDCIVASMAGEAFSYKEMIDNYLFADGTPFGIKE